MLKGHTNLLAEVNIIKTHSTSIKVGYEPVIHTRNIRQTCKIMKIDGKKCARKINNDEILRTGDSCDRLDSDSNSDLNILRRDMIYFFAKDVLRLWVKL